MAFKSVTAKLGNMRKAVSWTLCPQKAGNLDEVIIQCDKRIASVNLTTGRAMLSSGKGGHNGFLHLSPFMGATEVDVPVDLLDRLIQLVAGNTPGDGIGSVRVL